MAFGLPEPPNFVEYSTAFSLETRDPPTTNGTWFSRHQCMFCTHGVNVKSPVRFACMRYGKLVSVYACCDDFKVREGMECPYVELEQLGKGVTLDEETDREGRPPDSGRAKPLVDE